MKGIATLKKDGVYIAVMLLPLVFLLVVLVGISVPGFKTTQSQIFTSGTAGNCSQNAFTDSFSSVNSKWDQGSQTYGSHNLSGGTLNVSMVTGTQSTWYSPIVLRDPLSGDYQIEMDLLNLFVDNTASTSQYVMTISDKLGHNIHLTIRKDEGREAYDIWYRAKSGDSWKAILSDFSSGVTSKTYMIRRVGSQVSFYFKAVGSSTYTKILSVESQTTDQYFGISLGSHTPGAIVSAKADNFRYGCPQASSVSNLLNACAVTGIFDNFDTFDQKRWIQKTANSANFNIAFQSGIFKSTITNPGQATWKGTLQHRHVYVGDFWAEAYLNNITVNAKDTGLYQLFLDNSSGRSISYQIVTEGGKYRFYILEVLADGKQVTHTVNSEPLSTLPRTMAVQRTGSQYRFFYNPSFTGNVEIAAIDSFTDNVVLSQTIASLNKFPNVEVGIDRFQYTCPKVTTPSIFASKLPVYRFWSPTNRAHFYTVNSKERDKLISTDPNWDYESVAFKVNSADDCTGKTPVHRFWSPAYKGHFYTISESEKSKLINTDPNWNYENVAFCVDATSKADNIPVFRFWSEVYKHHFYTVSTSERDKLIATDPNWKYEGISYYVFK